MYPSSASCMGMVADREAGRIVVLGGKGVGRPEVSGWLVYIVCGWLSSDLLGHTGGSSSLPFRVMGVLC